MSLVFAYDTYYLIMLHMVSIFALVLVNGAIWFRAKKSSLLYAYLSVQGILLLWMMSKVLKTVAPTVELKTTFVVCQYVGVCFLGEVFLVFAVLFAKRKMMPARLIALLSVPPVVFLTALATNQRHMLFYSSFDFWGDSFGPMFYVQQAYNYILIAVGIGLCAKAFGREFGERRIRWMLFSAAILVPLFVNAVYIFGHFRQVFGFSPPCDITPISSNISLMMFALATFRFRFFDDVKIARRTALADLKDGILLVDTGGRIVDYNRTFSALYETGALGAVGALGEAPLTRFGATAFLGLPIRPFDETYETAEGSQFRAVCREVTTKDALRGFSLKFSDLTLVHAIKKRLETENARLTASNRELETHAETVRNLAIAKTRNAIASEVHDLLGHSIVVVISLLEVARLSSGETGHRVDGYLDKACQILTECIRENAFLEQNEKAEQGPGLISVLEDLARNASAPGTRVELSASGDVRRLPQSHENVVFKLCREGITNAIRHGGADRIDLILRYLSELLEVYVIDNGRGAAQINKGMGIKGLEESIEPLGGALSYGSFDGGGFRLYASLPLELSHS